MEVKKTHNKAEHDRDWREPEEFAHTDDDVGTAQTKIKADPSYRTNHEIPVQGRVDKQQLGHPAEPRYRPCLIEEMQIDGDAEDCKHKPVPPVRRQRTG